MQVLNLPKILKPNPNSNTQKMLNTLKFNNRKNQIKAKEIRI